MGLTERSGRARGFSAAPDPHQPPDQGDPAEARRIVQHPDPTAVTDRYHTAARTGRLQLARLHRQHQPLQIVDLDVEDVHANNIEDRISPGTPARTRAAHRVRHRRVLRNSVAWSLLILKDPASSLLDQHADPRSAINPCSNPKSPNTARIQIAGMQTGRIEKHPVCMPSTKITRVGPFIQEGCVQAATADDPNL